MYRKSPLEYIASGDFFFLGVSFQVGLSVASPRWAVGFTLQSLTLYVQMHEAPGTAEGFFFHFSITADTTVILRLSSVTGGIFPARWFTVSSMLAMLR